MIGYNTIVDNKATLETMVDLYQKQCDMYQRMAALGLANQTDVVSAQTPSSGQSLSWLPCSPSRIVYTVPFACFWAMIRTAAWRSGIFRTLT